MADQLSNGIQLLAEEKASVIKRAISNIIDYECPMNILLQKLDKYKEIDILIDAKKQEYANKILTTLKLRSKWRDNETGEPISIQDFIFFDLNMNMSYPMLVKRLKEKRLSIRELELVFKKVVDNPSFYIEGQED